MKNKIEDLRNHLFLTLENLTDPEQNFPVERARAIAEVAQTIINSAKAETEFLRVTQRDPSTSFIPEAERPKRLPSDR